MNNLVGYGALLLAFLTHFGAVNFKSDEVAIKLFLLAVAGIFLLRQEVKELQDERNGK